MPIFFVGAYFQLLGLRDALRADVAVQTWRPLKAQLTESHAYGETYVEHGESDAGSSAWQSQRNTGLQVRYRYEFNGKWYEESTFGFGSWTGYSTDSGPSSIDWARRHPKGSMIDVYVNPSNAEESAIDPRPTIAALVCMLVAVPFTLVGLFGSLSEQAQSRLSFEGLAIAWSALGFVLYVVGHAVSLAVVLSLAAFLALLWLVHVLVAKNPLSQLEEDLDAPPQEIADFRG